VVKKLSRVLDGVQRGLSAELRLSIPGHDDLLLTLVGEATEHRQQEIPRLEYEGHVRRRKMCSFRCRRMKSNCGNERMWIAVNPVFYDFSSSAEFFDHARLVKVLSRAELAVLN